MITFPTLLAQGEDGSGIEVAFAIILYLAFIVGILAGFWRVFEKAGHPGWAAIVPIYNGIVLLEIAGKPLWWIILMFIPCVSAIVGIIVMFDVAKNFGKGPLFGLGLVFFPFIFFPILGFGDAKYQPPPFRNY